MNLYPLRRLRRFAFGLSLRGGIALGRVTPMWEHGVLRCGAVKAEDWG